ncbi:Helix-turn-helix [Ruaniaceae bacterium KH17]|nr:Helix-turn-helix [Ruaniaceae bacterium KH17]
MCDMLAVIASAQKSAGLSQRALAERTGISQATLSRILSGARTAKMTEILLIADATGCTVAQLTGSGVADRVLCAARGTNGSGMDSMRQRLLHFMELDVYLDDCAIPEV